MLTLSCSLWFAAKVVGPLLNLLPAAGLMYYLKDDKTVRRSVLPIIGIVMYVGLCSVMYYSIKAARAAEIVVVDPSCSQR